MLRDKYPTATESEFDKIVQNHIQGGRYVLPGDIALVTRDIRTSVFIRTDDNRWQEVESESDILDDRDLCLQEGKDIGKDTLRQFFEKNKAYMINEECLTKEYRRLVRAENDLELTEINATRLETLRKRRENLKELLAYSIEQVSDKHLPQYVLERAILARGRSLIPLDVPTVDPTDADGINPLNLSPDELENARLDKGLDLDTGDAVMEGEIVVPTMEEELLEYNEEFIK